MSPRRHKWFAAPLGMKDRQCLVLAHRKSTEGRMHKQSVPKVKLLFFFFITLKPRVE